MVLASNNLSMATTTKEITLMASPMVKEFIFGKVVLHMKDNLRMV
jgi:hypothetical protein